MTYLEQRCLYRIEQGTDLEDYKPVRSIHAHIEGSHYGSYAAHQQCWAYFKCPPDMFAYWRRNFFFTEAGFRIDFIF